MPKSKRSIPFRNGLKSPKGSFHYIEDNEVEQMLMGDRYKQEFYKMSLNDPICGAVMLAITKLFQSLEWKAVDDDRGVLQKSLANVMFKRQLDDIMSQLIFGHSVMEVTMKKDEDGDVVWNRMYYRPQTTLTDWKFARDGTYTHVVQDSGEEGGGSAVTIPLNRCLLFNTTTSQTNPVGKSMFRNAYRAWHYMTNIERIEAIGIEKDNTGFPVITLGEDIEVQDADGNLSPEAIWANKLVRSMKRNAQEGAVVPFDWKISLLGSPGKGQYDLSKVINRYANNIALSMLNQFLVLGVTNESGSFALAKEQSSLFYTAVEGFAYMLADVINTQFIGAPALQAFNGLEKMPKLVPVGIEKLDIADLGTFLGKMLKYNIITPDDKLEEFIRDKAALPEKDETTSRIADVKSATVEENNGKDNDKDDSGSGEDKPTDGTEDDKSGASDKS